METCIEHIVSGNVIFIKKNIDSLDMSKTTNDGNTLYEIAKLCLNNYGYLFCNSDHKYIDKHKYKEILEIFEKYTPDNIKWLSIEDMLGRNKKYIIQEQINKDPYLSFVEKLNLSSEFKFQLLDGDSMITNIISSTYPEYKALRKDYLERQSKNSWVDFIKSKIKIALL